MLQIRRVYSSRIDRSESYQQCRDDEVSRVPPEGRAVAFPLWSSHTLFRHSRKEETVRRARDFRILAQLRCFEICKIVFTRDQPSRQHRSVDRNYCWIYLRCILRVPVPIIDSSGDWFTRLGWPNTGVCIGSTVCSLEDLSLTFDQRVSETRARRLLTTLHSPRHTRGEISRVGGVISRELFTRVERPRK